MNFKGCLCFFAFAGFSALLVGTGCETKSADRAMTIEPNSVTISRGQTITFTAANGFEYTWWLRNNSLGTLSTRTGNTVQYTSRSQPEEGSTLTQVLFVRSTYTPSAGTTRTNALEGVAEAYITHL